MKFPNHKAILEQGLVPIIAVDFDGTLFANAWPGIGQPNTELIETLKTERAEGRAKLILWTCRVGAEIDEALAACREQGLEFDAVNDNVPEIKASFGFNCRKIFANTYIDDKAMCVIAGEKAPAPKGAPTHLVVPLRLPMDSGIGVNHISRCIIQGRGNPDYAVTEQDIRNFVYDAIKHFVCWCDSH